MSMLLLEWIDVDLHTMIMIHTVYARASARSMGRASRKMRGGADMTVGEYTPRTWPKVDWTTEFTPEQWQAIQDQYRRGHSWGMETLETLDRYVLFSYEMIPDALKRFKVLVNGMGGALEQNPA